MKNENTYLKGLKDKYNIEGGKPDKLTNTVGQKNLKIDKIGKLHKANKAVKMQAMKDHIETQFLKQAFKANRADKQREARRAKR